MTIPLPPALPPHFNIGGYKITALVESGPDYHLYQALSPEGHAVLIREFCPGGLVTRDLASGELAVFPENESQFAQAREAFETQYAANAESKLRGFGTVLFLYPLSPAQPQPAVAHAQALRPAKKPQQPQLRKPVVGAAIPGTPLPRVKHSGGFPVITVIVTGMLALFGFLGYQILKDKEEPVAKAVTVPVPAPPKPKSKPAPPKPEPVVVAPEPEPVVVAPEPEPEPEPEPPAPDLSPSPEVIAMEKALREEAIASKGKFSEKLLNKYPYYAEAYVRDYVKKRGGSFSPDFEKWLKNTKNNREVFAMFFPPDPSVATNVAFMIDELGLETTEKYDQLVLAFAVGRREFGMGAFDLTQQGRYIDAQGKLNDLRSSGVMPPPADLYCAGKPPVNWYGNAPRTVDEECYKKVEAYLDRKKITPKQAWLRKYPTVSEIGDSAITEDNLAGFLHEYMYRHGQLRRKRDPFPTPVEFFSYLVDKYEHCGDLRDVDRKRVEWTGVSLEGTPWPAMMALSETRPLRECDSVWERYMGQRGPTRLWLYGPYRADDDKEPPILFSFDPDPEWSRESNERKLHEGGVCGTMSLISRNSQIARGIPAAPAGRAVARELLVYRYNQLDKAIENAAKLGFRDGAALYPMVTVNGEECHNEWEITFEEIHRNGAVAYAIFNYIRYTGDTAYLADCGLEVLLSVARFWAQRITWSGARRKYVMLGVTGPNEYENNVDNNWYTSYIACWSMRYAAESAAWVRENRPADYARICAKRRFDETAETKRWLEIADGMYFGEDRELGIFLQQDGYLDKEQTLAKDLDPADRPINQRWSWDRILRSCLIKQADVLQGLYFFGDDFDLDTVRRNFRFYEARTVHESSLSPCVHAILAARIGDLDKAYELYLRTARLDLDDYNREVREGCHVTSMAGSWLSVVEGFGGMRVRDGVLSFDPQLPAAWESLSFKVNFRDRVLTVRITRNAVEVANEGAPVELEIRGVRRLIADKVIMNCEL